MNDQHELDDATARLRRYLDITSHQVQLPDGDASSVRATAYRRTVRRRRAVTTTVAAATVGSLVVGLLQLSSVAPDDSNAEAPAAGSVPANPGDTPTVADATLVDSPFVWKVEDPGPGRSITTMIGPTSVFSGLAVSTAPGRVDPDELTPDDMVPTVWRSEDGITWEQTSLGSPFSTRHYQSSSSGDALYAVGTSPGIAASDPNPLQVAIARTDSEDWTHVDLPVDTNDVGEYPYLVSRFERSVSALDDGSALIAVTLIRDVDLDRLAEDTNLDLNSIGISDHGITVLDDRCSYPSSTIPVTIPAGTSAEATTTTVTIPLSTEVSSEDEVVGSLAPTGTQDVEECASTEVGWDELGVPAESIAAMRDVSTEFFRVTADGGVEAVESPAPGVAFTPFGPAGEFSEVHRGADESANALYRYDGAAWQPLSASFQNWMTSPTRVGDATMGWSWIDGRGAVIASVSADGAVSYSDPSSVFPEHSVASARWSTAAAGALVSSVDVRHDWMAAEGGVVLAESEGVAVRQDSIEESWYFVETATGEQIPVDRIDQDESGFTIRNANGEEIANFEHGLIEQIYSESAPGNSEATWSITTTTNGTDFSVESIADLLGVEDDDVRGVGRLASDGTQVVVVVTLTDTYEDGTPKQLTLVGTPRG